MNCVHVYNATRTHTYAHMYTHTLLYVTTDLGNTWTKIPDNVGFTNDYQW